MASTRMTHRHFKTYKPPGFVCQFVQENRRKKKLLSELFDFPEGTMAIGRLDVPSEGLLLLTTDGKVSHAIRSKSVEKEYYVQVDGIITEEAVEHMRTGVEITVNKAKYTTLPCAASIIQTPDLPQGHRIRDERHGPTSWVSITITEGKFRQVRKMTAAVGFPTLRLVRVRIADVKLDQLLPGEVEEINLAHGT